MAEGLIGKEMKQSPDTKVFDDFAIYLTDIFARPENPESLAVRHTLGLYLAQSDLLRAQIDLQEGDTAPNKEGLENAVRDRMEDFNQIKETMKMHAPNLIKEQTTAAAEAPREINSYERALIAFEENWMHRLLAVQKSKTIQGMSTQLAANEEVARVFALGDMAVEVATRLGKRLLFPTSFTQAKQVVRPEAALPV